MNIDMRQTIFCKAVDENYFIDVYVNFAEQWVEGWLNKKIKGNEYKGIFRKKVLIVNGRMQQDPSIILHELHAKYKEVT